MVAHSIQWKVIAVFALLLTSIAFSEDPNPEPSENKAAVKRLHRLVSKAEKSKLLKNLSEVPEPDQSMQMTNENNENLLVVPAKSFIIPAETIWKKPVSIVEIKKAAEEPPPPEVKPEPPKKEVKVEKPKPKKVKASKEIVPLSMEVSVILANSSFLPSKIRLKRGVKATIHFTTVEAKPAALIIERLNVQRWIAKEADVFQKQKWEENRWEVTKELAQNKLTTIHLEPEVGNYQFHDALSGAFGEIIVE